MVLAYPTMQQMKLNAELAAKKEPVERTITEQVDRVSRAITKMEMSSNAFVYWLGYLHALRSVRNVYEGLHTPEIAFEQLIDAMGNVGAI